MRKLGHHVIWRLLTIPPQSRGQRALLCVKKTVPLPLSMPIGLLGSAKLENVTRKLLMGSKQKGDEE